MKRWKSKADVAEEEGAPAPQPSRVASFFGGLFSSPAKEESASSPPVATPSRSRSRGETAEDLERSNNVQRPEASPTLAEKRKTAMNNEGKGPARAVSPSPGNNPLKSRGGRRDVGGGAGIVGEELNAARPAQRAGVQVARPPAAASAPAPPSAKRAPRMNFDDVL